MPEAGPPRVFISYSHDNPEHQDRVLALADRLRADGIDAEIDQYEQSPPAGWPEWCATEIRKADFVLMVCTETYLRRVNREAEPGQGHGVLWEANLIRQHLYDAGTITNKFVPILLADASTDFIPTPVRGRSHYRPETSDGYESLCRLLTNQPKIRRRPVGTTRELPERTPQWVGSPPNRTEPAARIEQHSEPQSAEKSAAETIRANAAGEILDTRQELFVKIAEYFLLHKGAKNLTIKIPELDEMKLAAEALAGDVSIEARQRRVKLLNALEGIRFWDVDRDALFTELANLVLKKFGMGKTAISSTDDVVEVLTHSLRLLGGGSAPGTRFDVYPQDQAWSKAFYLPQDEVQRLCEDEGAERPWLVDSWGLRVHHLNEHTIRKYVLPAILWEYLWEKYSSKNVRISDEVLDGEWYSLRVGLG